MSSLLAIYLFYQMHLFLNNEYVCSGVCCSIALMIAGMVVSAIQPDLLHSISCFLHYIEYIHLFPDIRQYTADSRIDKWGESSQLKMT